MWLVLWEPGHCKGFLGVSAEQGWNPGPPVSRVCCPSETQPWPLAVPILGRDSWCHAGMQCIDVVSWGLAGACLCFPSVELQGAQWLLGHSSVPCCDGTLLVFGPSWLWPDGKDVGPLYRISTKSIHTSARPGLTETASTVLSASPTWRRCWKTARNCSGEGACRRAVGVGASLWPCSVA